MKRLTYQQVLAIVISLLTQYYPGSNPPITAKTKLGTLGDPIRVASWFADFALHFAHLGHPFKDSLGPDDFQGVANKTVDDLATLIYDNIDFPPKAK